MAALGGSTLTGGSYAMARREILDRIQKYVDPFRITKGKRFRLNSIDPRDTRGLQLGKGEAAELLTRGTEWLAEEQSYPKIDAAKKKELVAARAALARER